MKKLFTLLISIVVITFGIKDVNALGGPGEIILDKTAEKYDVTYGRSAKVTLDIKANSFVTVDKTDVVLVLDRSSSMNNKDKMVDTKKAAIDLINLLITNQTKDDVRVAISTYGAEVFADWSSTSLTNDADELKTIINSIPDTSNAAGTNIQAGLKHAQSLLSDSSKDRDKIVILLSDGVPNRYIGTDGITICKKSDSSSICNSTPSDAPKSVAKSMKSSSNKNGAITIYTIGFDVATDSDAYSLLGEIATNANSRFAASDYSNLKTTFEEIVNAITTVATNGVVTDIVPAGFRIVEGSLTSGATAVENADGTTTITWIIGDISSNSNPTLSYEVEAIKNHYGSMYTNVNAILEADKVVGNPAYVSNDINLEFPIPVVPIPSVTNDDDYGDIEQGETLIVDTDNSILDNDELIVKHKDKSATVNNKIVLIVDDETNGDIDRIIINEKDGTFSYVTEKDELGKITYKYYVESEVIIDGVSTVVKSNTSKIVFNIIKNDTSYTVNYLEKGTNKVLHEPKKGSGYAFQDVTEEAIDINGYKLVSDNKQTITLEIDSKNNVINFYYVQLIGKVTAIYVDTEGNTLATAVETEGMVTTEYKTSAKVIAEYELIKVEGNETGKYTEEDIIVKYIYEFVGGIGDGEEPEIPQTGISYLYSEYISLISLVLLSIVTLLIRKKYTI